MTETPSTASIDNDPPVAFDSWAPIAAKMLDRSSAERLDILRKHSITPEAWTPSDAHWSLLVADEIAAGEMVHAEVYAAHCAAEYKARRTSDAPSPPVEAPRPPPEPVKEVAKEPVKAKEPVREAAPIAPIAPVVPVLPVAPIAPEKKIAPIEAPAAPPPMVQNPHFPDELYGTSMALNIPRGPSLPFAAKSAAESPLAKPAAKADQPPLPPAHSLGQTTDMPDLAQIARSIVPFKTKAPTDAQPKPAPVASPAAVPPAMVSQPELPRDVPELTLEQYASLCAELELAPNREQETMRRYHLRSDQKGRLDSYWTARFLADSSVHAAYRHAKSTYMNWLKSTRR